MHAADCSRNKMRASPEPFVKLQTQMSSILKLSRRFPKLTQMQSN